MGGSFRPSARASVRRCGPRCSSAPTRPCRPHPSERTTCSEGDTTPLDPEAAAILQTLVENRIPEWHTLLPVEARRVYRARVDLLAGQRTEVGSVQDLTIDGPGGDLRLRVYRPTVEGPLPILVYIHGGGWTLGDLESHDELCRRLCTVAEVLVVAVEYRLAPEHPYPAALEDTLAVVTWAREHGAEFGGRPDAIALGGDSAGGNLTAGAALYLRDHGLPNVGLQVLLYAALEARFDKLSFYENAVGKWLTTKDTIWFWRNFLGPTRESDPYAEPLAANSLRDLPPALIITAGFDPVRDDGEIYAQRLHAAGNDVVLRRYQGTIHGFLGVPGELESAKDAVRLIASTIRDTFGAAS